VFVIASSRKILTITKTLASYGTELIAAVISFTTTAFVSEATGFEPGNTKGGSITKTIDLLFDWFGTSCMTTDIFLFLFAKQTNSHRRF
jgi:hypothetical protein